MSPEPVRLVMWDLDDTFWRGTLVEGGIREYVQAHHDIVIELARRGIMSSICSKNDFETVRNILTEHEIWEYFIFPSINWEPKGPRLQAQVESIGLRPQSILFVDDHPGNRAEAEEAVPGLQVADVTCIGGMLSSPAFAGKPDIELVRLKQYKLLERRAQDRSGQGDNREFLLSSDIRVTFDYDVENNIDRAIELINRTNQLNFTKRRLPENPAQARQELLDESRPWYRQAALVRVADRYGDYGYCGFFLRGNGQGSGPGDLVHFCFSCRTLGMFVEQWVYDQLGRPDIRIVGPVLTDLAQPRSIDWIRFVDPSGETVELDKPIPQVRLRGGCEIDALAHYFSPYTPSNRRETSLPRGPFFVMRDCSHHLLTPGAAPPDSGFLAMAEQCGFTRGDFDSALFAPCPAGTVFVWSGWSDGRAAYRHLASGALLTVGLPGLYDDVTRMAPDEIEAILAQQKLTDAERDLVRDAVAALRDQAKLTGPPGEGEVKRALVRIFSAVPEGCRVAALAMDEYWKNPGAAACPDGHAIAYNRWLQEIADRYAVRVFRIGDYIACEEERERTAHFQRIVYFRLASAIIAWALK